MRPKNYKNNCPGVTSIIGLLTNLQYWYGKYGTKHCTEVANKSKAVGHRIHKAVEVYITTGNYQESRCQLKDEGESKMLDCFVNIIDSDKLSGSKQEEPYISKKYQFGGTMDLVTINTIYDWKTDSTPKDKAQERERLLKYKLQAAGYALLIEENTGTEIKQAKFIRVTKDEPPIVKVHSFEITRKSKKMFLNLREIYRELKGK